MAQFERAPDHDPLISSSYQPAAQHDSMYSTRSSEFGLSDSPPQQQPAAYNSLYNYAASPSATPMASYSDSPRFSSEQHQPLYGDAATPHSRFGSISASTLNVSSQQETRYEINAMDLDHSRRPIHISPAFHSALTFLHLCLSLAEADGKWSRTRKAL